MDGQWQIIKEKRFVVPHLKHDLKVVMSYRHLKSLNICNCASLDKMKCIGLSMLSVAFWRFQETCVTHIPLAHNCNIA